LTLGCQQKQNSRLVTFKCITQKSLCAFAKYCALHQVYHLTESLNHMSNYGIIPNTHHKQKVENKKKILYTCWTTT